MIMNRATTLASALATPALEMAFGFHHGVAVDGDTIAIGNHEENTYFDNNGAVLVYTYDGSAWSQQAKLWASDPSLIVSVGWSVALEGDRLVAGAQVPAAPATARARPTCSSATATPGPRWPSGSPAPVRIWTALASTWA